MMNIDIDTFKKYGVDEKDIKEIYDKYRLYNRILQSHRHSKIDKEEYKKKSKITYHCDACDKTVRVAIKYHHSKTMKHLHNIKQLEDAMNNEVELAVE